ncbi:hypothetical protein PI125_g16578 [Phytophthora idaei]|nr:hypothetical protein PI125_g16578 [Phytophthora idaei]KAG3142321.1 hypothetical protein PI126_g15087 [Phytophthora idaei]
MTASDAPDQRPKSKIPPSVSLTIRMQKIMLSGSGASTMLQMCTWFQTYGISPTFTRTTPTTLIVCVALKQIAASPLGHGTVQVMVKQGASERTVTLYDVFYVPDSKNLLSHSQAEDQGYCVEYHGRRGDRKYEFWKDDEKLLEVGYDQYDLYTFAARNSFLSTQD